MKQLFYYEFDPRASPARNERMRALAADAYAAGVERLKLQTSGFIRASPYSALSAQQKALARVYALVEQCAGTVVDSGEFFTDHPDDFIVKTRAWLDIDKGACPEGFEACVPEGDKAIVLVNFYTGLLQLSFELIDSSAIINDAVEQFSPDKWYDPAFVLPAAGVREQLVRQSVRVEQSLPLAGLAWYRMPGHEFVAVEIAGYTAHTNAPQSEASLREPSTAKSIKIRTHSG